MMKKVLITGATGAIGTALVSELISHGIEVLVLCRKESSRNDLIPEHPLVKKKFCALNELVDLQNETNDQYDVFYHFAWDGTNGDARNDVQLQLRNVKYCTDAILVAKRFGCKLFVGAGSQAEYGRFEGTLTSQTPVFPENCYGIAKLAAGQLTRVFAMQNGLQHIWVRILSVYGPNDGPKTLVMSLIKTLRNGEVPKMTKGEQQWDYLYSKDAAKAFYLLGEKGIDGKTYVLGSGASRPLHEYAEIIRKTINPSISIDYGAIPYGEKQVMHLCADITELTKDTGWKPTASFAEHIQEMLS